MNINTQLLRTVGFVTNFVFDLKDRLSALFADLSSIGSLTRKSLAIILVAAILMPSLFFEQAKHIYAAPLPIDSSVVPQSFPNPYDFSDSGSGNSSAHLFFRRHI